MLRSRDCGCRARRTAHHHAELARSWKSRSCLLSPRPTTRSRVHRVSIWTISASSVSIVTASWSANAGSAGCSRRPPIRARLAPFHICGARSTTSSAAPDSTRTAIPARRWSMCWKTYPRDELFQIDEARSINSRLPFSSSTSGPVFACCRGGTASTVRVDPRLRSTRSLRQPDQGGDRRNLATTFKGRLRAYSRRFSRKGPLVRVHLHYRTSRGRRRLTGSRRSRSRCRRSCELVDGLGEALAATSSRTAGAPCALSRRISDRLPRGLSAGDRGRRYSHRRGADEERPLGVDLYREAGLEPQCAGLKSSAATGRFRSPSGCRCWRIWASAWWTSAPTTSGRSTRRRSGFTT